MGARRCCCCRCRARKMEYRERQAASSDGGRSERRRNSFAVYGEERRNDEERTSTTALARSLIYETRIYRAVAPACVYVYMCVQANRKDVEIYAGAIFPTYPLSLSLSLSPSLSLSLSLPCSLFLLSAGARNLPIYRVLIGEIGDIKDPMYPIVLLVVVYRKNA